MNRALISTEQLVEFIPKTCLTAICKKTVVTIPIDEITHISQFGRDAVIYTPAKTCVTIHGLDYFLADLPVNDFFQVHRSHVVAVKHIQGMMKGRLVVADAWLPISKVGKLNLKLWYAKVLNENYNFLEKP